MLIEVRNEPFFVVNQQENFDKVIILISGYAGSGKTTFADFLCDFLGSNNIDYERLRFADYVKDLAYFMGWDGKKDRRGRELLQYIGNIGRFYTNGIVWVDDAITRIVSSNKVWFVIDDFRYPNEYYEIVRLFHYVYTIRVERELTLEEIVYNDYTNTYNHPSELSLRSFSLWNYVVYNYDLDELKKDAELLYKSITDNWSAVNE